MPVRQGFTLSLRHLLILLSAVGLVPLALLGAWSIHTAGQFQQAERGYAALDLARALSGTIDAELDGSVATLSSMAHAPAMAQGDIHAFYDIARAQAAAQPNWLGVFLADSSGRPLFRTTAPFDAAPAAVADPASLAQALSLRRPVVGHIARGKGGRLAFPVRIPVFDDGGRLYVLSAVIQPDRLVRAIMRQALPEGASVAVLDAAGTPAARTGPAGVPLRLPAGAGPEYIGPADPASGAGALSASTRLSRYGWTVVVTLSAAARASALTGYGAGIAASLALCIAVASLLAARISRRFARLQRETAALGAGQPVAAPPSRVREIRAMGQSLEAASRQQAAHAHERAQLLASLEQASRAKDEFLAVLGHELRNPLSPIAAALDLMDLRDEPANRRERAILRRQVQHLKRLVDDLLDVSRITTGKLQLDLHPLDLAALVRECAAAAPQAVQVQAPPALWVRGDDSRLAQVLNNLLSNAARFGSTRTTIGLVEENGMAKISVDDNGVGMRPALLAQVFEPFYQAPQQMARRTGGLGLGLAIVRRIVELHGGRVAAHSEGEGRGSRFEVLLPAGVQAALPADAGLAADSAAGPAGAAADAPHWPGHARQGHRQVLLVDDNEDATAVTAALLTQLGCEVGVAHTAQAALAALAALKEGTPAVAILDIGLPDMNGYALARAVRDLAGDGVRLVALSGYGQAADVARALAAGFDLHLTKPATLDDLRRAVDLTPAAAGAGGTD